MQTFRPTLTLTLTATLAFSAIPACAEIYIYRGDNGERMVTDKPMPGFRLMSKQDSIQNAGRILANRPIDSGGPALFQSYIRSASDRYGVDPALIEAVIQVESNFDPDALSSAGAQGLMQLMPQTAKQYKVKDRRNPRENINAGVKHLSHLMTRFEGRLPLVLAAYNAGAGAVERYNGIPPYPETQRYVQKVMNAHARNRGAWFGAE